MFCRKKVINKKIKGEKYIDMDIYVEGGIHTVPCTQSC